MAARVDPSDLRAPGDEFGEADYRCVEFADYGHQDVFNGALSARDTFPAVLEHLRRVGA